MNPKAIEDPKKYTVCRFDGVAAAGVYTGLTTDLQPATKRLKWNDDTETAQKLGIEHMETLTLAEITEQLGDNLITVIINEPLGGTILQYGNYNDGKWYVIGETCGYW